MSYVDGIKIEVKKNIEASNTGAMYISRAVAEALAGRPPMSVCTFGAEGRPYLSLFGGALVAVDAALPAKPEAEGRPEPLLQRTWLPVLDNNNDPIKETSLTARAVSDSGQRCIVKAIAMTYGVGAAVFLGFNETRQMLVTLGLKPDADLTAVAAYTKKNFHGTEYVHWMSALIAARLTDPAFHWSVVNAPDGLPVFRVASGWAVQVRATYKGVTRSEWLPLMGEPDHVDITNPTVFDWNTAVMRALAKVIAYLTGYGLSVYAGDDLENLIPKVVPKSAKKDPMPAVSPAPAAASVAAAEQKPAEPPAEKAPKPEVPVAQPQTPTEATPETPAPEPSHPEPETPISENLKANLSRVSTVTDTARLQSAAARANELFNEAEALIFKKAIETRLAELQAQAF